jgi:hypothetical protein
LRIHGKSTSSNAAGKRFMSNHLNGNVQSSSSVLDVNDNSSGDESPQFVGVKTRADLTPNAVNEALVGKLAHVQKRAGKLVFSSASLPGTAAKASKVYKCIVSGNDVIASICCDFPNKLLQKLLQ